MPPYAYIRNCACTRCRAHGLMGPAMIITTGVLWLLDIYTRISWNESWPAYLLVAGLIIMLSRTASVEGHVAAVRPVMVAPPQYQNPAQAWTGSAPPPPPTVQADQPAIEQPTDQQVKP